MTKTSKTTSLSVDSIIHAKIFYYAKNMTYILQNILNDNDCDEYKHLILFLKDYGIDFTKKNKNTDN